MAEIVGSCTAADKFRDRDRGPYIDRIVEIDIVRSKKLLA
jgi:hypothetical protein